MDPLRAQVLWSIVAQVLVTVHVLMMLRVTLQYLFLNKSYRACWPKWLQLFMS